MSYRIRRARFARGNSALGGVVENAKAALSILASAASDPALTTVLTRVQTIRALGAKTVKPGTPGSQGGKLGLGLDKVVPALDAYIYVQRNPWALPVGAMAVVGVPMLFGYLWGRKDRR